MNTSQLWAAVLVDCVILGVVAVLGFKHAIPAEAVTGLLGGVIGARAGQGGAPVAARLFARSKDADD